MAVSAEPIPALRPVETFPFEENGQQYLILRDPQGFTDKAIAVALGAAPLLSLIDGSRTAAEIANEFENKTGIPVNIEELEAVIQLLRDSHMLETPQFHQLRMRMEEDYRKLKTRPPALAGTGYPDDADELAAFFDGLLASPPDDDREAEFSAPGKMLRGLILPHIDFARGGMTYGRGYREILSLIDDLRDPILLGIIGVAHQGAGYPLVAASKDFETPFGALKSDTNALQVLRERLGEKPFINEWAHRSEHSVELQIVWLQHLLKGRKVTLLPLVAGILSPSASGTPRDDQDVEQVIAALKEIEESHEGSVIWVASVDFAHTGPYFGDSSEVNDRIRTDIARYDLEALQAVKSADADGWWRSIMKDDNKRRICGLNATYLVLRLLEGSKGVVVDYQQFVSPDANQMVSYAAAILQDS
ncbi:MAG: AmmeMemoRadiSam system protein B [bacterium]